MQRALVKLETVTKTTCSRWHADHVAVRGLVTYIGAGTEFVSNQYVDRKQLLLGLGVQDTGGYALRRGATVQRAGPGDVLLLKGHAFQGFDGVCVCVCCSLPCIIAKPPGRGAAHRSPEGATNATPRLLLTIDDEQSCC